jgi:hypothetical protein
MRAVTAKIIKGKGVTKAKLPEGARLTVHDLETIKLDTDDEAAIATAMAEIRAGNYVTSAELRAFLRRP